MRSFALLLLPLAIRGCPFFVATQDVAHPDRGPHGSCVAESAVVGPDDPTPAGFTAGEVLEGVTGERATTLSYDATGVVTDLTIELVYSGGDMRWVDQTWVWEEGAGDTGATSGAPMEAYADTGEPYTGDSQCQDRLEIPATLLFFTADGAFAEEIPVVIVGNAAGVGRVDVEVAYDDLSGSYVPEDLVPAEWDEMTLSWAVNASTEGLTGEIALFATSTSNGPTGASGAEDVSTEMATQGDIARFPAP